jgi:hypothetical protein
MTANYVLLEKITVGAATAASVTFSGIPQTGYTDLVVHMSPRTTSGNIYGDVRIKFNGANTNFSARYIEGNGATASSGSLARDFLGSAAGNGSTANTFSSTQIYIPNYTSANYKSFSVDSVQENNATTAYAGLVANLWSNTAAINEITFYHHFFYAILNFLFIRRSSVRYRTSNRAIRNRWRYHYD